MTIVAFLLILCSACSHVVWNLLAKKNHFSLPYYAGLITTATLVWLHVQFWTPIDIFNLSLNYWLAATGSLVADLVYCGGLVLAYQKLEMSIAYPIMRSLPILMTALVTTLFGWGKPLSWINAVGFVIIFVGALFIPLLKFSDFKLKNYLNRGILYIIIVASGTTAYTIFDKFALEQMALCCPEAGNVVTALTYYSLRVGVLSIACWIGSFLLPGSRRELIRLWRERNFSALKAGVIASCNYICVLVAMNFTTNVSYVQVARQIGLPLGMFAGIIFLKERFTWTKVVGVTMILGGLVIALLMST